MRGPRAFIALTFYLALLAGFTVMIYLLSAQSAASQAAFGGGNPYASASVGQAVFTVLLFLQVLLVVFLAPAATSGAISLEREKQTLDLLTATPVSTLGIVLGKLASALAFVVVLILASIPLTAVVFVFGGVGPEDIAPRLPRPSRHGARVRVRRDPPVEPDPADPERHRPDLPRGPGADRGHRLHLVLLGPDGGIRLRAGRPAGRSGTLPANAAGGDSGVAAPSRRPRRRRRGPPRRSSG